MLKLEIAEGERVSAIASSGRFTVFSRHNKRTIFNGADTPINGNIIRLHAFICLSVFAFVK